MNPAFVKILLMTQKQLKEFRRLLLKKFAPVTTVAIILADVQLCAADVFIAGAFAHVISLTMITCVKDVAMRRADVRNHPMVMMKQNPVLILEHYTIVMTVDTIHVTVLDNAHTATKYVQIVTVMNLVMMRSIVNDVTRKTAFVVWLLRQIP